MRERERVSEEKKERARESGRERETKDSPLEYIQLTRRKINHQNIKPTRIKITHKIIDSTLDLVSSS